MSEWGDASSANLSPYPHSLFNDKTLSDVQVKLRHGQHIFAHKPLLTRQSEWFFRAFTGNFPVASSKEICLDDEDDDPEAILAMIRHVYGFPYDYLYESGPPFAVVITDLMFHINVFTAADKYDVPSLRLLVVEKFVQLMDLKWSADQKEFCTAIQRLCGPKATAFAADRSLQACAASFCSKHITDLVKFEDFVSVLEQGEPFAGRLLTAVIRGKSEGLIKTVRCYNCSRIEDDAIRTRLGERCINCDAADIEFDELRHYKNFMPL
ncbi:hypothetical protein E4T50_06419 [Aureobasidium sp. EXF-12298]|nr:hypothetical protein E4T50_06419 [Aureobasidium sp. EXF-12298]KAI4766365.1 hypothetical protein E4T51_00749 [Aureobasidium sp. EXF-12344]KAI4783833.1 hypothetical protein E4T52_01283 [Aureobasidium sp. EXF-3400]